MIFGQNCEKLYAKILNILQSKRFNSCVILMIFFLLTELYMCTITIKIIRFTKNCQFQLEKVIHEKMTFLTVECIFVGRCFSGKFVVNEITLDNNV